MRLNLQVFLFEDPPLDVVALPVAVVVLKWLCPVAVLFLLVEKFCCEWLDWLEPIFPPSGHPSSPPFLLLPLVR